MQQPTGTKRALVIGINYQGTPNELHGCITDAENIRSYLLAHDYLPENIVMFTDHTVPKPTREVILQGLKNQIRKVKKGDTLFFSYSGHGGNVPDLNGDEKSGRDECIYPIDLNPIIDDDLKAVLDTVPEGVKVRLWMDSCYSGSNCDLPYRYRQHRGTFERESADCKGSKDILEISGCRDDQTSEDAYIGGQSQGALTYCLLDALKRNPSATWKQLISVLHASMKRRRFDQCPQLSCADEALVDRPIDI